MICRNCNYILSGKENFCPNCGTMPCSLAGESFKQKEVTDSEKNNKTEKEMKASDIYPVHEFEGDESIEDMKIFYENDEGQALTGKKSGRTAGKIFVLLFLTCTFTVTAFGLADYFGITPIIKGYVQTLSQKYSKPVSADEAPYSHKESIVEPDVSYTVSDAYVMSGNGLTLRKGPDNSYAPLYSLTDLTKVHIFGGSIVNESWVYVFCPEKESYGWLDGSFLATEENAAGALLEFGKQNSEFGIAGEIYVEL